MTTSPTRRENLADLAHSVVKKIGLATGAAGDLRLRDTEMPLI